MTDIPSSLPAISHILSRFIAISMQTERQPIKLTHDIWHPIKLTCKFIVQWLTTHQVYPPLTHRGWKAPRVRVGPKRWWFAAERNYLRQSRRTIGVADVAFLCCVQHISPAPHCNKSVSALFFLLQRKSFQLCLDFCTMPYEISSSAPCCPNHQIRSILLARIFL